MFAPLLARLYILTDRLGDLAVRGLRVLHRGFWLGLLGQETYAHVATLQYGRWPKYRSEAHNLSGFFPWEREAVARWFPEGGAVLVSSAGGGREVLALARAGHRPAGFECQPTLAALARRLLSEQGLDAEFHDAAPDAVPPDLGTFDAVLVGWGSLIHIPGRARRVAFLADLRTHVRAGAPLLCSFFTREEDSRHHRWVLRIAKAVRTLRLGREPLEPGDVLDGTFDHAFTEWELRTELREAGWEVVHYDPQPFPHAVAEAVNAPPPSTGMPQVIAGLPRQPGP